MNDHLSTSGPPTALPLERRAGLARETLRLIRDLSDSLVAQAEQARRRCREAGDPEPMANQLAALLEHSRRLREQGERLTRAFVVLDRLIPPAPPGAHRAGSDGQSRAAARAFAMALKLDGASREHVEMRLIREFGRRDARQIAGEAFGRRPARS